MKCLEKLVPLVVASALSASLAGTAYGGGKISIDNTKWISIGAGLRTTFGSIDDPTAGEEDDNDFRLNDARIYINGQVHEHVKFELNTYKSGSSVDIADAIIKLDYNGVNLWMGQLLPPSGRANMSGPFYQGDWSPAGIDGGPHISAGFGLGQTPVGPGRDNGAALWGMAADDRLKWKVGLFEGQDGGGNSAKEDNLMFTGRLQYNFWDTEAGYYNASTYFGAKDILAIGIAGQSQDGGATGAVGAGDFTLLTIDVLVEKNLGNNHVATGELVWTDVDRDSQGVAANEGDGYSLLGGYQINDWKGTVRYTKYDPDATGTDDTERLDVGLHYIIDGHNARISLTWTDNYDFASVDASENDAIVLGIQLQL